ncbi:MAG: hypothetical protein RR101_13700 [Burkholderiaceae bacterium]
MPLTVFAGLVFCITVLLAGGTIEPVTRSLAADVQIPAWIVVAVPALMAALFAVLVYQGAGRKQINLGQSTTRALLIAGLVWLSFAGFVTAIWAPVAGAWGTFINVAALSAIIGGGPLLIAALLAGAVVGLAIERRFYLLRFD